MLKVIEKQNIVDLVNNFKSEFIDAGSKKFDYWLNIKMLEKAIKDILNDKNIKRSFLNEAEKEGIRSFDKIGAKWQIVETGVKYDYSVCDDNELNDLLEQQKVIDAKVKERQEFLKTIKGEVFDSNGIRLNPPIKISETIVKCEIK